MLPMKNGLYIWQLVHSTFERSLCQSLKTDKAETKIWIMCLQNSLCPSCFDFELFYSLATVSHNIARKSKTRRSVYSMHADLRECINAMFWNASWKVFQYIFFPEAISERKLIIQFSCFSIKEVHIKWC